MKCAVCRNEFGDGENCRHCGTDRVSGLGKYEGYTPKNSINEKHALASVPDVSKRQTTSTYIICYKCAETIPKESVYCPKCGIRLMVECPKCGHVYSSQYPICNQCGTEREKYIAEQKRLAEQRAIEERRRQEAERLRLEEQRRKEQEAERLRQEEQRRKEEEAEREKIRRQQIINTEWYQEAYDYMMKLCAIYRKKELMISFLYTFVATLLGILAMSLVGLFSYIDLPIIGLVCMSIIMAPLIIIAADNDYRRKKIAIIHKRMINRYIRKHDTFKFTLARKIVFHIIEDCGFRIYKKYIQDYILGAYNKL